MDRDRVAVPYFDGQEVFLLDPLAKLGAGEAAAVARFLALGPEARAADARHVLAYWLDMRAAMGAADSDAEIGPPPADPAEVWARVKPRGLSTDEDDGHAYVALEANVPWEPEHGLMMVWRDGDTLVKVGPYDGHYDDHGPGDVPIYVGHDEAFTTTRGAS